MAILNDSRIVREPASPSHKTSPKAKQLLPHMVEELARLQPEKLYAEVPLSPTSLEEGYRKITYRNLANAVNGMAWFLKNTLGPAQGFPTLQYIGPNDSRHYVLALAAVKWGGKMILNSPRYSVLGQVELLKKVDCTIVLEPEIRDPSTVEILKSYDMKTFKIPGLDELYGQHHPRYPYDKTFAEARNDPLVVLHTSGSTGLPKPIIWTHDWAASFIQEASMPLPAGFEDGRECILGNRVLAFFPPFHAGGLFGGLLYTIGTGMTQIYPLTSVPPGVGMIVETLMRTQVDTLMLPPIFVEALTITPDTLQTVSELVSNIAYGGGSVNEAAGKLISQKINLCDAIGSTETGLWPIIRSLEHKTENWGYFNFNPSAGIELRQRSENMYEAVFVRKSGIEEEQPVFKAFPELHEFCTKDLFMRHPSNPQLWQHRGRLDDMQTFTSGSKYCPADVEDLLQSHKEINSALLVGTGRPQAGLLLEMMPGFEVDSVEDERATIERLWPTIEEANKMCTIYARMTKELVCFATPSKPLERTPKGTVQRAMSVKLYETELDELFATFKLKGNLVPKEISALPNLQPGREDHFGWTVKLPKSFITTGLLLIVCTVIYLSPMFA